MKALQLIKYGKLHKTLRIKNINIPKPGANEVLIKIQCAALNPIDYKIAQGKLKTLVPLKFPFSMGFDVSGIVESIGGKVGKFEVGNKVFGRLPLHKGGAFAEYVTVDENLIALMPNTTFEESASLPLVALTVFQALNNRTRKGMKILIHAGSGGVGSFAVQYAKNILYLEVTATTSRKNVEFLKALGADHVIAYDEENYLKNKTRYDVVFDTLGGSYTANSFKVLKKGGFVVSIGGPPDFNFVWQLETNIIRKLLLFPIFTLSSLPIYLIALTKNSRYFRFLTEPNGQQLSEIKEYINERLIIPIIDKTFPFDNYMEAMDYQMTGRAKGKVVLKIRE